VKGATIILALALAAFDTGCALTSRGDTVQWQYFTPERVRPEPKSPTIASGPDVCLGRVTADASLGRRIAYGNGGYEVGYYEDRRWTDEPEHYVRRALERTLFQEDGFRCDHDPSAFRIDIEVLRFEELRPPARHAAHIALRAVLTTPEERVVFDQTVQTVDPVVGPSFDAVMAATERALDGVTAEVTRRARAALAEVAERACELTARSGRAGSRSTAPGPGRWSVR
jgi:cholesterol transport system auxiliary component